MDKVKINLFGESWSLKELELEGPLKSKIDLLLNDSTHDLNELLLDLTFYEELNLSGIESIKDLPGTSFKGLQNSSKSQIEVWLNGKKILKLKLSALFYQNTLFKLYQTQETVINFDDLCQVMYVFEHEMGLVSSYQFTSPKFSIDQITFGLLRFQDEEVTLEVLTEIFWNNVPLTSINSDTVVISSNCRVKKSKGK